MTDKGHTSGIVATHSQHFIGNTSVDDVLRFQVDRLVKTLFKSFLVIIEDLAEDHDRALEKLSDVLPDNFKPYVKLADYLDEETALRLRGKILDAGNSCLRELQAQIDQYDISLPRPKN